LPIENVRPIGKDREVFTKMIFGIKMMKYFKKFLMLLKIIMIL